MGTTILLNGAVRKYKGNLHAHSTRSDGEYSPETVIHAYRDKGYDFMCLSDHEIYFRSDAYNTRDFIVLSGAEMSCGMVRRETGQAYHMHTLLDPELNSEHEFSHDEMFSVPKFHNLDTVQQMIDGLAERGNFVIINHPEWSKNKQEELLQLTGFSAIEIYNNLAEVWQAVGYGTLYWDYLLRHGRKVMGVATDDAHGLNVPPNPNPGKSIHDSHSQYFGGWVQVEAVRLDQTEVIGALKAGRFYSSNGPEIHDLRVEDGMLRVSCSDVRIIKFITYPYNGKAVHNPDASTVVYGEYKISGDEHHIRVECTDHQGKTAWSSPLFLDEITL